MLSGRKKALTAYSETGNCPFFPLDSVRLVAHFVMENYKQTRYKHHLRSILKLRSLR